MCNLKFIDFCAGIGGGRLGLTQNGLDCVAYSEIDEKAEKSYKILFGENEKNLGDLTKIDVNLLPNFDLLIGGFPCQTFSIMGKREGFNDDRGLIVYSLAKILKNKNIPYFILENVKGIINHDKGKTFKEIVSLLESAGYNVNYRVLDSLNYGVPQMRERVYFVGIRNDISKKFSWPEPIKCPNIDNYLIDYNSCILDVNSTTFQKYLNNKYNRGKFDIDEILKKDYLVLDTRQSDLRIYENKVPTLRNGRHGILYVKDGKLNKITPYEGLLLQGFPLELVNKMRNENINKNRLLSQVGNAMTVCVISAICKELLKCIGE